MDNHFLSWMNNSSRCVGLFLNSVDNDDRIHTPSLLGQVFANPEGPKGPNQFCWVRPVTIRGQESEGGLPEFDVETTGAVPVCVLGSKPPQIGDFLICVNVAHRWVSYYSIGKANVEGITLDGCFCNSIPSTLHMNVSGSCDTLYQQGVLQYGPTPADLLALNLGTSCFLSSEPFVDAQTGLSFLYHLQCDRIFFRLSRIILSTASAQAFEDYFIYSWSIGQPGNSCSPFLLSNGTLDQGSNSNCQVVISP